MSFYSVKSYLDSNRHELKQGVWRKTLLRLLPYFSLLPAPFPFLSFMGASRLFLSHRQNLSYRFYSLRTAVEQMPLWARYREVIDQQIKRKRQPFSPEWPREVATEQRSLQRMASFQRLRCLLLSFEGILIIYLLSWVLRRHPSWISSAVEALSRLTLTAFLIPLAGLFLILISFVLGFRRTLWPEIAAYVALTQFCLGTGLLSGQLIDSGHIREWGQVLEWVGLVGCMVGGGTVTFRLVVLRGTGARDLLLWGSLAGFVGLLGAFLATEQLATEGLVAWVRGVAILSPILNLVLGGFFLSDLLYPFQLRQAVRWCSRWGLALLLFVVAAPLGGLLIPLWVYVRHRWWPHWIQDWMREEPGTLI